MLYEVITIRDVDIDESEAEWVEATIIATIPNRASMMRLKETLNNEKNITVEAIELLNR